MRLLQKIMPYVFSFGIGSCATVPPAQFPAEEEKEWLEKDWPKSELPEKEALIIKYTADGVRNLEETFSTVKKFWGSHGIPIEFEPEEDSFDRIKYDLDFFSHVHLRISGDTSKHIEDLCLLENAYRPRSRTRCYDKHFDPGYNGTALEKARMIPRSGGEIISGLPALAVYFPASDHPVHYSKVLAHEIGHILGLWHRDQFCQNGNYSVRREYALMGKRFQPHLRGNPLNKSISRREAKIARDMLQKKGTYSRLFRNSGNDFRRYLEKVARHKGYQACRK